MNKEHSKYIKHIEESLIKVAPKKTKEQLHKLAAYIGTKHDVLGVTTPLQRQMAKSNYGLLKNEDWLKVLDSVYKFSNVFEVKNTAFYIIDNNSKSVSDDIKLELLPEWINFTDNWAHSDSLSKLYTGLLESKKHQNHFLKTLKAWNGDSNLWKRRQSLVSLYYYARCKSVFLPYATTQKLISNLLHDKEYFVQKGLGWALRESFNVYPNETYEFMTKNASAISSTAFSASIEKMSIKQKEVLKEKRKKSRIKN